MQLIRLGTQGEDVARWVTFLIGQKCYSLPVASYFSADVEAATKRYQLARHLLADGIVGNQTLNAATTDGFALFVQPIDSDNKESQYWPPRPWDLSILDDAGRREKFGSFSYTAMPSAANPEAVKIESAWVSANIELISVPDVAAQPPFPSHISLHKLAKEPFLQLIKTWSDMKMLDRILTWDGGFSPRFKRGSVTSLSNHAWGTAFDINAPYNALGTIPALVGKDGCVRELVQAANTLGWYWGGHFSSRQDGMHFELVRV